MNSASHSPEAGIPGGARPSVRRTRCKLEMAPLPLPLPRRQRVSKTNRSRTSTILPVCQPSHLIDRKMREIRGPERDTDNEDGWYRRFVEVETPAHRHFRFVKAGVACCLSLSSEANDRTRQNKRTQNWCWTISTIVQPVARFHGNSAARADYPR